MKFLSRHILVIAALVPVFSAWSQSNANGKEDFSIKANANIGLGNAMNAKYALPEISSKASASDFGIDFGWTFWRQRQNSLEANIGLGYGCTALKAKLPDLDYHYSAPATADMDNEPYIRYCELDGINQKISTGTLSIPVYLTYRYEINDRFSLHALAGMKLGFNVSSKINKSGAKAFCYGVYPQYDDLMIDAPYMNDFGESELGCDQTLKPEVNSAIFSLMAGVGAEARVWGPISAGITFKYEGALSNLYKTIKSDFSTFNPENVPVRYTVAEGQKMMPLSSYLNSSKLSRFAISISLLYHF